LSAIGSESSGEIGFVYADGDGVGKWLFTSASLYDFRQRSQLLRSSVRNALRSAFASLIGGAMFEILLVGGDDVMAIVPAKAALPLACRLVEAFEAEMGAQGVSLSVGVAFGRDTTPVRLLRDLARDLLKYGAKRRRFEAGEQRGYIDFHDLTREGLPAGSIRNLRDNKPYSYEANYGGRGKIMLRTTARPYRHDTLQTLLQAAAEETLPNSQFKALARELDAGKARSTLFYLYQRSRLKPPYTRAVRALEGYFNVSDISAPDEHFPWRLSTKAADGKPETYDTPLKDLVLVKELQLKERSRANRD
jgi:hypothetical protein